MKGDNAEKSPPKTMKWVHIAYISILQWKTASYTLIQVQTKAPQSKFREGCTCVH